MKKAKKVLSVFLCVLMLSGIAAFSAFAAEPFDDLKLVQAFDYTDKGVSGDWDVVLMAAYDNTGFSNVKFNLVDVTAAAASDVTIPMSNKLMGSNHVGFNSTFVDEDALVELLVDVKVEYKVLGVDYTVVKNDIQVSVKKKIDKTDLEGALAEANKKFGMRYDDTSFAAFSAAKTAAKTFLDDITKQDYEEYDGVLRDLIATQAALVNKNAEGSAMDTILKIVEMFIGLISSAFGLDVGGLGLF